MRRKWPAFTIRDRLSVMRATFGSDAYGFRGRPIRRLEADLASYTGARHAIGVSSGTTALMAALAAVGVGPGHEVLTPVVGFVATPMAILGVGARAAWVDIHPRTLGMDLRQLEDLICERTRAIMPVALHGIVRDVAEIDAIGKRYGIPVVWDVCQALGATVGATKAGGFGAVSAHSMNVTKLWLGIEGGAVTTDDDDIARAVRLVTGFGETRASLGPDEERAYWSRYVGYNGRLHPLGAALAVSRLRTVDQIADHARAELWKIRSALAEVPGVVIPAPPERQAESPWQPRILLQPEVWGWDGRADEPRDRVIAALRRRNVLAGTWQRYPFNAMPAFRRTHSRPWHPGMADEPLAPWNRDSYIGAQLLLDRSFVLGVFPRPFYVLSDREVRRTIAVLRWVFDHMEEVLYGPPPSDPLRLAPPIPAADL